MTKLDLPFRKLPKKGEGETKEGLEEEVVAIIPVTEKAGMNYKR